MIFYFLMLIILNFKNLFFIPDCIRISKKLEIVCLILFSEKNNLFKFIDNQE